MRILFGPENDHRQTLTPAPPGAYEWWYFDALSEDGRYAVVAIFFLGSPMTPYYKAVVNGKHPDPLDWCGVFFTLHEKVGENWEERAYAYNLYREGEFSAERPEVTVGGSRLIYNGAGAWSLSINERGLWGSPVKADITFQRIGAPLLLPPIEDKINPSPHSWVCVAPSCRVAGSIGSVIFQARGYHDHNFGILPFDEVGTWYWVYAELNCSDGKKRFCLLYYLPETLAPGNGFLLLLNEEGRVLPEAVQADISLTSPHKGRYGFHYFRGMDWKCDDGQSDPSFTGNVRLNTSVGRFAEGSFYVRLPAAIYAEESREGRTIWFGRGEGIGEVFRPSRLCGPIVSRAMWSRIRRRNRP